jgi:hypothetical protein
MARFLGVYIFPKCFLSFILSFFFFIQNLTILADIGFFTNYLINMATPAFGREKILAWLHEVSYTTS